MNGFEYKIVLFIPKLKALYTKFELQMYKAVAFIRVWKLNRDCTALLLNTDRVTVPSIFKTQEMYVAGSVLANDISL